MRVDGERLWLPCEGCRISRLQTDIHVGLRQYIFQIEQHMLFLAEVTQPGGADFLELAVRHSKDNRVIFALFRSKYGCDAIFTLRPLCTYPRVIDVNIDVVVF